MESESDIEKIARYEKTIRFDELDDESFQKFSDRVKEKDGVVRIFVHPTHLLGHEEHEKETFNAGGRIAPVSEKPIFFLVRTAEIPSSPPIIVFENAERVDGLRSNLENAGIEIPNALYVMPTIKDYPYPKYDDIKEPERDEKGYIPLDDEGYEFCVKGMMRFIAFLDAAGVKKVLLGGSMLTVKKDDLNHCVGNFINFFKHISEIELKISNGTIPHGRKELRELGYDDLL